MDELAYAQYIKKANKAEEIRRTIFELYGFGTNWRDAYFMAIKDKLLSKEEKALVKEFYPVK